MDFVSSNCTYSPKQFKNFTVSITGKTLSIDMDLARPITRGFKAFLDYKIRMPNAKSYQTIFTRLVDVCATVSSVKDGIIKSWFKSMAEYGNFMKNCPVEVGNYYLRNWKMGSSVAHHFLHPGDYRSTVEFFYGKHRTKTEDRVLTITYNTRLHD